MAEENEAGEAGEAEEEQQKSGGMMKKIIFGTVGLVLVGVGVFAGPAIMNMVSPPPDGEADGSAEVEDISSKPEIYQSLHPPLVVNFKDSFDQSHYMQVTLEVMSRDQDVINSVREHTPAIRNSLILLFSQAEYESVITREGKQQMLDEALVEIQDVMVQRIGEPGVEDVYFTALVIQ